MKNLLVFASAVLVGAAAFAGSTPRVYSYSASLNTTIAKNAAKVTYYDADLKQNVTFEDICYRAKGKISVKGVIVLGCSCNDFDGWATAWWDWDDDWNVGMRLGFLEWGWNEDEAQWQFNDTLPQGYPLVLMATSADKYQEVVYVGEVDSQTNYFTNLESWEVTRFGNPISAKAKDVSLGFDFWFTVGGDLGCGRTFYLDNVGFGTAAILDKSDNTLDVSSVSGYVIGDATAPICSAAANNCPRCLSDDECQIAIAFTPCNDVDPLPDADRDEYGSAGWWDVLNGTFTLKFNKTLSTLIKPIKPANIQGTIDALVPKAFTKTSIAPVLPVPVVEEEEVP